MPPEGNVITRNVCLGNWLDVGWFADRAMFEVRDNYLQVHTNRPATVVEGLRRMKHASARKLGIVPIPFERIGLRRDAERRSLDNLKRFRKDFPHVASSAPLGIQLPTSHAPILAGHLGLGETNAPGGRSLWADNRSLYRDGKPWVPVMGEIHFTRYPREEWRDALLKMKAVGIDIVATYVFWIHHEEVRGAYDWSGQRSLRDFLTLCHELGLHAFVRMGPWSHGEVRNGGFPDWLQKPDKKAMQDSAAAASGAGTTQSSHR